MDKLSAEEFALAIGYMDSVRIEVGPDEYAPTELPYGLFPGQATGGGSADLTSKDQWDRYIWNPPEFDAQHPDSQEGVASKPTWEQLVEWATQASAEIALEELRLWTREQICTKIYDAHDLIDEIHNHIEGSYSEIQHGGRQRICAKYRIVKTAILAAQTPGAVRSKAAQGKAVLGHIFSSFPAQ